MSNSSFKKQVDQLLVGAVTVPNALSLIRIILIPVFLVLMLKGHYVAAIIVIAVSGLTDFLDGKIARKFNQISNLGKLLDPIADKLTEITLAIAYFFLFHRMGGTLGAFSWVFWLFVLKEVLMIVGGVYLLSHDITPMPAVMAGKVATFAYYLVMLALLLFSPVFGAFHEWFTLPDWAIITMVCISVVLTFYAFTKYAPQLKLVNKEKAESDS